jgi:hypothetical protein
MQKARERPWPPLLLRPDLVRLAPPNDQAHRPGPRHAKPTQTECELPEIRSRGRVRCSAWFGITSTAKHQPHAQLAHAPNLHNFSTHHNGAATPTTRREAANTHRNLNHTSQHPPPRLPSPNDPAQQPRREHPQRKHKQPPSCQKSLQPAGSAAATGSASERCPTTPPPHRHQLF